MGEIFLSYRSCTRCPLRSSKASFGRDFIFYRFSVGTVIKKLKILVGVCSPVIYGWEKKVYDCLVKDNVESCCLTKKTVNEICSKRK